jgi:hypothetical protein
MTHKLQAADVGVPIPTQSSLKPPRVDVQDLSAGGSPSEKGVTERQVFKPAIRRIEATFSLDVATKRKGHVSRKDTSAKEFG